MCTNRVILSFAFESVLERTAFLCLACGPFLTGEGFYSWAGQYKMPSWGQSFFFPLGFINCTDWARSYSHTGGYYCMIYFRRFNFNFQLFCFSLWQPARWDAFVLSYRFLNPPWKCLFAWSSGSAYSGAWCSVHLTFFPSQPCSILFSFSFHIFSLFSVVFHPRKLFFFKSMQPLINAIYYAMDKLSLWILQLQELSVKRVRP